jgi:hypothetical protein
MFLRERARTDEAVNRIWRFFWKVKETTEAIAGTAIRAAAQAEIEHDRAALLRLYRTRHKWKKADIAHLKTYRLNKAARKRVAALAASKLLGRGSTASYTPLGEQLAEVGRYFVKLFDPATPGHERMKLLKSHRSWWQQFVEMTYRGEYERLKKLGAAASSEKAEQAVANAFCISRSSVRRICILVRRDPASLQSKSESLTVANFELWKQSGRRPDHDVCETEP